jgi:sulfite oxidase
MPAAEKRADFVVRQASPFNGGPPLAALTESFLTPLDAFFVRNHGDVPEIDHGRFRLRVEGLCGRPGEWSLDELAELPRRTITATLQCAGNRRQELIDLKPIPGELPWGSEAIGSARWAGVSLADLLARLDVDPAARHVELEGCDTTERHGHRVIFGGSIPLEKALASEVLLAFQMNGEPLTTTHGAPLRAVVPGYIGARSVKWLTTLRLLAEPSENYFQAHAYRLFPAAVGPQDVVWEDGLPLGEQNVSSSITRPEQGAEVDAGRIRVEGVALSGGRPIARVEVSTDGGATWRNAELGEDHGRWAWRQWQADVDLAAGEATVVVRAWDNAAQTQPERVEQVWNFKGYMNNAWPRLTLHVR